MTRYRIIPKRNETGTLFWYVQIDKGHKGSTAFIGVRSTCAGAVTFASKVSKTVPEFMQPHLLSKPFYPEH